MKIYIHTDLEGVTGIDNFEMMERSDPRHHEARKNLMLDLNAAVDGAFAGGADHVTVLDSHAGGGNFLDEMLDKRAFHDTKPNKKWWGVLDASYQATFFIGAHAMAGTINGFLDHTQSSLAWYNYYVNKRRMGELAQWAIVAGAFGVPLVMVSGDEAGCAEARQFFHPLETAAVKRGVGRNRAVPVEPAEARQRIREAARRALSIIKDARPFTPLKPMEIIVEYTRADHCDSAALNPANERVDARSIRKWTDNPLELFP